MALAEGTDRIDDLVHFPQGHTVHPLVQILKGSLHCICDRVIALMVIGEEHLQDAWYVTPGNRQDRRCGLHTLPGT